MNTLPSLELGDEVEIAWFDITTTLGESDIPTSNQLTPTTQRGYFAGSGIDQESGIECIYIASSIQHFDGHKKFVDITTIPLSLIEEI